MNGKEIMTRNGVRILHFKEAFDRTAIIVAAAA